jgi:hypothetical protein
MKNAKCKMQNAEAHILHSAFCILHSGGVVMENDVPAVGQAAPEFSLPATIGERVTLSQYRGQKNVALAFYVLDWTNT